VNPYDSRRINDRISQSRSIFARSAINGVSARSSYLSHHAHKRPYLERFQGYADKVLVEEGADEEDGHRRRIFTVAHFYDWYIKMPETYKDIGH